MGFSERIKAAADYEKKLLDNTQRGSGQSGPTRGFDHDTEDATRGSGAYVGDTWFSDWKCAKCSLLRPNWTCFGRDFVCKSCGGSKDAVHLRDITPEEGQTSAWRTARSKRSRLDLVLEENARLREAIQPVASANPFARVGSSPFKLATSPFSGLASDQAPLAPPS